MQRIKLHSSHALAFVFIGLLAGGPVFAEKPAWAGGGKDGKHEQGGKHEQDEQGDRHEGHDGDRNDHEGNGYRESYGPSVTLRFDDGQRNALRNYYTEQIHSGHCPPGLAKKHNGCMPPGQAKKWAIGQQLPRDVIFYDLSPEIVIHLGTPPPLHRYVRVASDILLIAVGTGMVVDAIEDLSRL